MFLFLMLFCLSVRSVVVSVVLSLPPLFDSFPKLRVIKGDYGHFSLIFTFLVGLIDGLTSHTVVAPAPEVDMPFGIVLIHFSL